jgi:hypothetical protein
MDDAGLVPHELRVLHAHVEDLVVFVPAWSGYDGYQIPAD